MINIVEKVIRICFRKKSETKKTNIYNLHTENYEKNKKHHLSWINEFLRTILYSQRTLAPNKALGDMWGAQIAKNNSTKRLAKAEW